LQKKQEVEDEEKERIIQMLKQQPSTLVQRIINMEEVIFNQRKAFVSELSGHRMKAVLS
jgi:hypothetical protein